MSLTPNHVRDVCVESGYKSCRYLILDESSGKYLCGKLIKSLKNSIDERVDEFIAKTNKNGQDLKSLGRPIGDNCKGYLMLKHKKQGYDIS